MLFAALSELAAERSEFFKATPPGDIQAAVAALFDVYEAIGDLSFSALTTNSAIRR